MRTRFSLVVLLLASLSATIVAFTQGEKKPRTVEDYSVRTLRQLSTLVPAAIATSPEYKDQEAIISFAVHGDLLPSRVQVLYDGATRPLIENKKSVIRAWANEYAGAPEFYTRPYETETLFTENGAGFWLPVKKESLPRFEKELKKGDPVELFVIKLGSARIDGKLEPVLLVENFVKQ